MTKIRQEAIEKIKKDQSTLKFKVKTFLSITATAIGVFLIGSAIFLFGVALSLLVPFIMTLLVTFAMDKLAGVELHFWGTFCIMIFISWLAGKLGGRKEVTITNNS